MPAYVVLYKWTPEDAVNIKQFPARAKQAKAVAEQQGVRVVGGWVTMGEYDMVVVYDAPDEQTFAVVYLAQVARGLATTRAMRALNEDEFAQIVSSLP